MKRLTIRVLMMSLMAAPWLSAGVGHLQAGTILIDFEEFTDGFNLHGVNLGGVTLINPSGRVTIHDNRFGVGYHSATKAIASPAGLVSVNPLIGVFERAVSSVSLWGGDEGWSPTEMDSWDLLAYDARVGGNLVGRVSSGSWVGSPYRRLSLSGESIWRFEAIWTGPQFGIGYDDLQFVTIPPPEPEPEPQPEPPQIVDPSNASFDGILDKDVLTIDFGEITQGIGATSVPFDLWNLPSSGTTADLNVDALMPVGSGDFDVFATTLLPFSGLAPSTSQSFQAFIDTNKGGSFSATFDVLVSDATGTPQTPLRMTLTAYVVPEPSALVLTALGLLSLLGWGWWRRRAG